MFGRVGHFLKKAYTGNLFNGVGYEQDKLNNTKAQNFEEDIAYGLRQRGFIVVTNLYLPTAKGSNELDVVAINNNCILVIEAKAYSATISGHVNAREITAYYRNGKQYKSYNPLKQNTRHIEVLARYLGKVPLTGFVIYPDDALIKLHGVQNYEVVNLSTFLKFATRIKTVNLSNREINRIVKTLQSFSSADALKKLKHQKHVTQQRKR